MTLINDIILQNRDMVWSKFLKKSVKGLKWQKVAFSVFPIWNTYVKTVLKKHRQFSLSTSLHMSKPRFFWTSRSNYWLLNKSQPHSLYLFYKGGTLRYWWMVPLVCVLKTFRPSSVWCNRSWDTLFEKD